MIIDANNAILGRIATVAAKKALLGEKIDIVNCETAVITGDKKEILARYVIKFNRGTPSTGPFIPKMADRFVRRAIRGMLPYKQAKGRDAFQRIMCYKGVPTQFEGQKIEQIKEASVDKLPNLRYVTVQRICKQLGAKQ